MKSFLNTVVHVVSLGTLTLNVDLVNIIKMISNGGIGSKLIGQHGMAVVLRLIGVVDVLVEAERRLAWEEIEVLEVEVSLWWFNALPAIRGDERTEEELQDTGTGPVKRTQMDLAGIDPSSDSGSKRRLDMEENSDAQKENFVGMPLAMITDGNT
jgi:hypothetical protein